MYKIKTGDELNQSFIIKIESDKTLWIPLNESLNEYQEYLKWVSEGNTVEEWEAE
jgi:hypothetical protein